MKRPAASHWKDLLTEKQKATIEQLRAKLGNDANKAILDLNESRKLQSGVARAPVITTAKFWHLGLGPRLAARDKLALMGFPSDLNLSGLCPGRVAEHAGLSICLPPFAALILMVLTSVDFKSRKRPRNPERKVRVRPAGYSTKWRARASAKVKAQRRERANRLQQAYRARRKNNTR